VKKLGDARVVIGDRIGINDTTITTTADEIAYAIYQASPRVARYVLTKLMRDLAWCHLSPVWREMVGIHRECHAVDDGPESCKCRKGEIEMYGRKLADKLRGHRANKDAT